MKSLKHILKSLAIAVAVGALTVSCATRADVEEIVGESNELIAASNEAQALLAATEDDSVTRADGGVSTDANVDRLGHLVEKIDTFIAKHPRLASINDALRMRKGFVLLNAGRFTSARAAFDSVVSPPLNARDRAIHAARDPFVWCYEVLPVDTFERLPTDEVFRQKLAALDEVIDHPETESAGKDLLASLRGWTSIKRIRAYAQGADDIKKAQVLASARSLTDVFEGDAGHLAALAAGTDAAALQAIPPTRLRWLHQAILILRQHATVARDRLNLTTVPSDWPEPARAIVFP